MIDNLVPYNKYKHTGLVEINKLPSDWKILKLRHICQMIVSNVDKHDREHELPVKLCNYVDVYKNEKIIDKIQFMKATATADEILKYKIRIDDVLITKDSEDWTDIGVPSLVQFESADLVCAYHLAILRPFKDIILGEYLFRALQTQDVSTQLHVRANGVTRYGLSHNAIKSIFLPVPSIKEQEAIVNFLNYFHKRLSRLINAKKKTNLLLKEQILTITQERVLKGLNNTHFKKTSIAWLDQIPKHWSELRSKYIFREKDTKAREGNEVRLSMSQRQGLIPSDQLDTKRVFAESKAGGKTCKKNDLVLNRLKAHLGVFSLAPVDGIVSPDYSVFTPIIEMDPRYFEAVYKTPACRVELRRRAKGIVEGFWRLYTDDFYDIRVPVPPIQEQKEIMDQINIECLKLKKAMAKNDQEINLLREYQTKLASDVVTGRIDVREISEKLKETEGESIQNGKDVILDIAEEEIVDEN